MSEPNLKDLIGNLIQNAIKSPDEYATISLSRGLILTAKIFSDTGVLWFGICRGDTYPSNAEWVICVRALPDFVVSPEDPPSSKFTINYWLYSQFKIKE